MFDSDLSSVSSAKSYLYVFYAYMFVLGLNDSPILFNNSLSGFFLDLTRFFRYLVCDIFSVEASVCAFHSECLKSCSNVEGSLPTPPVWTYWWRWKCKTSNLKFQINLYKNECRQKSQHNAASVVNHLPAGADMDWSYWVTNPVMAIKFHDRMMVPCLKRNLSGPKFGLSHRLLSKWSYVSALQNRERGGPIFYECGEDGWRDWQRQSFPIGHTNRYIRWAFQCTAWVGQVFWFMQRTGLHVSDATKIHLALKSAHRSTFRQLFCAEGWND